MEILKWGEVVGSSRRASSCLVFAAAAGFFCMVVFAVALCAKTVGRHRVGSNDRGADDSSSSDEDSHCLGEAANSDQWPKRMRWNAMKNGVLSMVSKSGRRRLLKGEEVFRVREDSFNIVREGIRTQNVPHVIDRDESIIEVGNGVVGGGPVWQRRILMGERCQLPTFSGLILYDERGNPLPHYPNTRILPAENQNAVYRG